MKTLKNFVAGEAGLESIEYAVIAGLIVTGAIVAIAAIAIWLGTKYDDLKTKLGA